MPNKVQDHYSHIIKNWPKEAGRKPSNEQLLAAQRDLKIRPGSKTALAVAMALRPTGATQQQITKVLGHPHRNKLRELTAKRYVKRVPLPDDEKHKVYKIKLNGRKP